MPNSSPSIICSITLGTKSPVTNVIKNATVQKSHSTAIFIFQSSRAYTSLKMKNTEIMFASFSSYGLCIGFLSNQLPCPRQWAICLEASICVRGWAQNFYPTSNSIVSARCVKLLM
jgi:hypothetical protein